MGIEGVRWELKSRKCPAVPVAKLLAPICACMYARSLPMLHAKTSINSTVIIMNFVNASYISVQTISKNPKNQEEKQGKEKGETNLLSPL